MFGFKRQLKKAPYGYAMLGDSEFERVLEAGATPERAVENIVNYHKKLRRAAQCCLTATVTPVSIDEFAQEVTPTAPWIAPETGLKVEMFCTRQCRDPQRLDLAMDDQGLMRFIDDGLMPNRDLSTGI